MDETGEFQGKRVRLRHMVRADIDQMARWPRFWEPDLQWANLDLTFPAERDAYFERGRTNATRRRFVIVDEHDEVIGTVGLRNLDFQHGEATLGIIIRADRVGRGYGTDAMQTVIGYAFDVLELERVVLDVAEGNHRARRVYENLGFVVSGSHLGPGAITYIDMVLDRGVFDQRQPVQRQPPPPPDPSGEVQPGTEPGRGRQIPSPRGRGSG
ncbi:MAG TPA: GNAT family N-acetyltransferase [Chloroflexota bacterium]|nr:GNAT family N-acetyltransferase [Chloroflexota bacterium]